LKKIESRSNADQKAAHLDCLLCLSRGVVWVAWRQWHSAVNCRPCLWRPRQLRETAEKDRPDSVSYEKTRRQPADLAM